MKNYSKSADIDKIKIDFVEQFVRSVVDTTISNVVFKEKNENIDNKWKEAIKLIKENNDVVRLLKSDTRQKSKYGKSYVGFDIFENKPIIWVAPYSPRNIALRINGMEQYAVRVIREYSAIQGQTPILRNEVVYTDKTRNYLFLGGFGLNPENNTIKEEKAARELHKQSLKKQAHFPLDYAMIATPKYILDNNLFGLHEHNLGILQVMEMLNKDVADYGFDEHLSDLYPANDYLPLIVEYVKFIALEMNLDHTRVIGMFSYQDLQGIQNDAKSLSLSKNFADRLQKQLQNYAERTLLEAAEGQSGEDAAIKKRLIIRSIGGEGASIQVMNSKFEGEKHFEGLQSLISLIYKICGYSWSVDDTGGTYENVSQTQQTIRSVFETTKEKNELFTRQWKQFFLKVFYVLFDKKKSMEELEKEFDENVDFQIVSNILLSQQNDWRRTMELHNNNLISTERAIKLIWPELNDEEIQSEVNKMKEQFKEENSFNNNFDAFDNQKPFGSKEFNKEDKVGKDE